MYITNDFSGKNGSKLPYFKENKNEIGIVKQ
jgi:hypothetical protein